MCFRRLLDTIDQDCNPPRVYGYGRHSTAKQSLSEAAQRAQVDAYVQNKMPMLTWGGWFYDSATSGRKPLFERPAGKDLWSVLEPGDHIVWVRLDRAFRCSLSGAQALRQMDERGIHFHSLDLGIDTSTPVGRLMYSMLIAIAELEREFVKERTSRGLAVKKAEGRPYCRESPIGWRKAGKGRTSTWRPSLRERRQVARMCELRTQGATILEIEKAVKGFSRGSGFRWNKNSVSRALRAAAVGFPCDFSPSDADTPARGHQFPPAVMSLLAQAPPAAELAEVPALPSGD